MWTTLNRLLNSNATRLKQHKTNKTRLQLDHLEERMVLTGPRGLPVVPDFAGGTLATARVMVTPAMNLVSVTDNLPSETDIDMYKLNLKKGDYFIADVDKTGFTALAGSMSLLNVNGAQLATTTTGTEPENGAAGSDPSLGYWVQQDGTYYLRLNSSAKGSSTTRSYQLNLQRVALEDTVRSASTLQAAGAFHAWLNQAGDTLNITGPTGYGFSLRGTWTTTNTRGSVTYSATGTMYLKTAALAQTIGELPLQVAQNDKFSVKTKAPGWNQLGELSSTSGKFGFSLVNYAADIKQAIGVDLSNVSLANGWTIKTGAQIKSEYQGYVQNKIGQLLDGVPYMVYGQAGSTKLEFGKISFTSNDQSKLVVIAEPADPFLYVGYKQYAFAGSLHGRIPFNTMVTPPPANPNDRGEEYFGHVYAAGEFPIANLPFTANGDVTVNLDANRDGMLLGGAGNANQLFKGNLSALENVLQDVTVGINGGVNFGYDLPGNFHITVPLGQASAVYSGPNQGVWFKGVQGTAMNPWAGTFLEDFQAGPGTTIEGFVLRNGQYSISNTTSYRLFTMEAALKLTLTPQKITAEGTVKTPIGTLDVNGKIKFNGDFSWNTHVNVDIGNSSNYLRGNSDVTFSKTGSQMKFDVDVDVDAKLSISGAKATGSLKGDMTVRMNENGQVTYAASELKFKGNIYVAGQKVGSWHHKVSLEGKKISFTAFNKKFSINLP